jgi:hypothetical protein
VLTRTFARFISGTAVLLLICATSGRADSLTPSDTFTFSLLPGSGSVSGSAGSTVGWGFSLTNNSASYWLAPTALNSDLFPAEDSPLALFDPLLASALAPGETLVESFDPVLGVGLFQLTWAQTAAVGTTVSGAFTFSSDFFTSADFSNFVGSASDQNATYTASVVGANSVPEPSAFFLLISGAAGALSFRCAGLTRKRHRSSKTRHSSV